MDKREWMLQYVLSQGAMSFDELQQVVRVSGALYDAICAATPTVADEGWVEHDGDVGKAPAEDAEIEVVFRGGGVGRGHGGDYAWDHDGAEGDIVRWRYV